LSMQTNSAAGRAFLFRVRRPASASPIAPFRRPLRGFPLDALRSRADQRSGRDASGACSADQAAGRGGRGASRNAVSRLGPAAMSSCRRLRRAGLVTRREARSREQSR
jgi:hypothetical protein